MLVTIKLFYTHTLCISTFVIFSLDNEKKKQWNIKSKKNTSLISFCFSQSQMRPAPQ